MIRIIFALIASLFVSSDAPAWYRGIAGGAVVCNFATGIATGVGAGTCIASPSACDGATDNTAAFLAFTTWATGTWQATHTGKIELRLPAATCKLVNPGSVQFAGIADLLVSGYGSTLIGDFPHIGVSNGVWADLTHSVRVATVSAGASSVTVTPSATTQPSTGCASVAACVALFPVGSWAYIGMGDLQAGTGFPNNQAVFEFVQILTANSGTGVITFTTPLTSTYKSTSPSYNTAISTIDYGGPATLFALHSDWNSSVEWRGITFNSGASAYPQQDFPGKTAIFKDVTCSTSGVACFAPSINKSVDFNNVRTPNSTLEPDKEVEDWTIVNSSGDQMQFQSAGSFKRLTMSGSTYRNIIGTPSAAAISNSTITEVLYPGATNFGASTSTTLTNVAVGGIGVQVSGSIGGSFYQGVTSEGINHATGWSMASGVITVPNSYILQSSGGSQWMMPNANICWADGSNICSIVFQITDITQDGSTNISATISNASPAVVGITSHGRAAGDVVSFYNSGACALPAPLSCSGLYFVIAAGLTVNTFEISATLGGAAINTTTAGTGPFFAITGNTYVHTSQAGGFPAWIGSGKLGIKIHPAPQFTCSGCSVSADAIGLNSAVAGAPLYSYGKRTYVNANTTSMPYWTIWGNLSKMNVTVNTLYAGVAADTITPNSLFGDYFDASAVLTGYVPIIVNLKGVAGLRALDATGGYPAAWSGPGASGDTRTTLTQPLWAYGLFRSITPDISGDPGNPMSVMVEVTTSQGVVIP